MPYPSRPLHAPCETTATMGKKRRSRRSAKRFRFAVTFIVFAFSTLLLLQSRVPRAIRLHLSNTKIEYVSPSSRPPASSTPLNKTSQKPHLWFQIPSQTTSHDSTQKHDTRPVATSQSHPGAESPTETHTTPSTLPQSNDSPMSSQKPRSWMETLSSMTGTRRPAGIPEGPYPLLPLSAAEPSSHRHLTGAAWAASLTKRVNETLPLHWLAELLHAAPATPVVPASSIFSARRKGAWIGCDRRTHLVCKGAYRAIKKTNAITIVDLSCGTNSGWLPHVIQKLRGEFRLVSLTCIGERVSGYDKRVRFLPMDPYTQTLPNGTDLLLAYKFVESGTLISAMRLFKNVKRSGVKYLLTENFPDAENKVEKIGTGTVLRLNGAMPPFWFPAPEYEYEDEEKNVEKLAMQITVSRVAEMFEEKLTPGMAELVDPRKRTVRE